MLIRKCFLSLLALWWAITPALADDPIQQFGRPNADGHADAPDWAVGMAFAGLALIIILWWAGTRKKKS
ncbi:MAG: hypothetical protein AAGB22_05345 [Bacteroidota bacterium]